MKKILLILITLPFVSFAQKTDTIPFKGCDRVIIKNNLSAEDNFKLIKKVLADNEIEIANQDSESKQVKTGILLMNNAIMRGANYYLLAFSKENQITLKGYFKTGVHLGGDLTIEDGYQAAKYFKPKKPNVVFEKMTKISKDIPGKMFYGSEN